MAFARIFPIIRPYPNNTTTLYIIQILISITLTFMINTENYILHNFIEHNELQKQSIHNPKHTTILIKQQNVTTTSNLRTINTMINIHNPPSLPNITLYKLYFPDPPWNPVKAFIICSCSHFVHVFLTSFCH